MTTCQPIRDSIIAANCEVCSQPVVGHVHCAGHGFYCAEHCPSCRPKEWSGTPVTTEGKQEGLF